MSCLLAFFLAAGAGAQIPHGSLRGTVEDPSQAAVPSAKIAVSGINSTLRRETTSDSRGDFSVEGLAPGLYKVVVTAPGFAAASAQVTVAVSSVREITVRLKLQPVEQSVTLSASGSPSITTAPIDASTAVHQAIISSQDLDTFPLAARSFANIAYLAPGTEPVEPSDPTKARITAVSTGGSSGLNNEMSVDGLDNSDDWIGGFLQNFSPEAIQEFAIRTGQEDADTGRTTAGSVVLTTKSGTNQWHGDEVFYERASALNARFPIENPAPAPKQPFSRQNYVATLGGPIVKDKLWFFSSFEFVHENASIAYSPASQQQFSALSQLASQGLLTVGATSIASIPVPSSVVIPFRDYLGLFRLDWNQSNSSHWFFRSSADSYTKRNALVQQATLPSTGATTHNNYWNFALSNQETFSPAWAGTFAFGASLLHLTQTRNSDLGFALAFPFSSTSATTSGFETFGDNQFVTAITAFPLLRNQEKYQFRYDLVHVAGNHELRFGVNLIHEPVLSGALTANAETLVAFVINPSSYAADPQQFSTDLTACSAAPSPSITPGTSCTITPAGDGSFSQNVQRLGFYAEDSWRINRRLTLNYGLRYDTTFGLFVASGRDQSSNPALLANGIISGIPHDYRKAFAPRVGVIYALDDSEKTVLRGGFGLYYDDLTQNGWVESFNAVNTFNIQHSSGPPSLIDPNYHTPYALHASGGIEHAFTPNWILSADTIIETGMHGYRRYDYPTGISVFRSDNRSSYKALEVHLQGNVSKRLSLIANYTLASAKTWGCVLGELFDYVNGVCDTSNPFGPGDYGPSGEDVRHRAVFGGTYHAPAGFVLATLFQAESARPFVITTADNSARISVHGVPTTLDEFRGTPYIQADLRVSRPFELRENWSLAPFIEFFNLFNRNNPGANYVTNVAALPVPAAQAASGNVTDLCTNPACTATAPIRSLSQLAVPAGGLGDFFGPGTTVGIPFAAQIGVRLTF
ncbi:MAG TPA: carboxypeptidase regulatory-like domain-containing protein [Candidatus Acidoferrum sp.]|nr:carboxypeptidase regulatory-like domain-containing protein [Candidatus Acidoferrum sp.]